ncbi:hypothetical protein ACKWTF_016339 [Chironomus riparius]
MLLKLLILSLITTSALTQTSIIICSQAFVDDICTCNFLIFNPNGFNNLTVVGNPITNCTFEDTKQAIAMGSSPNIPSAICSHLPNLEKLVMENVGIINLNGMPFRNCGNLKTLQLGNNEIVAIPAHVFSFTALELIELNNNNLTTFDEHAFDNLFRLTTLNINENSNGIILPETVFHHLISLQSLLVSNCGITTFNSSWFASLRSLILLDLSRNNFSTIPENTFRSQQSLRLLNLSFGQLETIPETTFQNITNLLILDLQSNKIKEFHPNLFSSLTLLQNLHLSDNLNVTTPSNIFRSLQSLRTLELSSNNVTVIDGWFSSLSNLININLSNNNIITIPDNTFTAARALQRINLSRNKVGILDSRSFGSLHMMTELDVHDNLIDEVDHSLVSQSSILRIVNFSNNSCTQLRTDSFNESRSIHMDAMKACFDKFDLKPIELQTFNSTIYNWYSIRSNDGWDALHISVKAYENVHIALSNSTNTTEPPIEIIIGKERGRGSSILDQGVAVFSDNNERRLNETAFRDFIIGWRFGIVMVFEAGEQMPFMGYNIQNRYSVDFFGLRTIISLSDHKAEWKASRLQVSSTKSLEDVYADIKNNLNKNIPIDLNLYLR